LTGPRRSDTSGGPRKGAQAAALVTNMVVMTMVGGLAGYKLDVWWDTAPWLMVTGFFLGFSGGMLALFRTLTRLTDDDDDQPPDPAE
jgi:F0F1-type ATP synthase assembly protein I